MPSTAEAFQNLSAAGSSEMNGEQEEMQQFMHNNETAIYAWLKTRKHFLMNKLFAYLRWEKNIYLETWCLVKILVPEKPVAYPIIYGAFNLTTETPMILMEEVKGGLVKVEDGFTEIQVS